MQNHCPRTRCDHHTCTCPPCTCDTCTGRGAVTIEVTRQHQQRVAAAVARAHAADQAARAAATRAQETPWT